jgi:hypothetical protein
MTHFRHIITDLLVTQKTNPQQDGAGCNNDPTSSKDAHSTTDLTISPVLFASDITSCTATVRNFSFGDIGRYNTRESKYISIYLTCYISLLCLHFFADSYRCFFFFIFVERHLLSGTVYTEMRRLIISKKIDWRKINKFRDLNLYEEGHH